ncbi:MAG: carboxymethylenebutenolidase [Mycobacteriaceae bacterium]|nr:carboxymethylenebutenolidase [Mycobacteriaceae bacterium]
MAGIYQDAAVVRRTEDPPDARLPLTVVEPARQARGGIVVLHETHRLSTALFGLLRALSGEGWLAVVPHLFHRALGAPEHGIFGAELVADVDACLDWLSQAGVSRDRTGILGFDEAGTAAFLVATSRPVGAVVSVAARGIAEPLCPGAPALVTAAPRLQAPWLGLFGVDDPATPVDQVAALADAVGAAPVATNVVTYAGLRHRPDGPNPVEAADEDLLDARTRVFDWFDSFLR